VKEEAKISRNTFVELTFLILRYLKLFEIIPGPQTSSRSIGLPYNIWREILGKTSVVAKDTPAFIGNRIDLRNQSLFHLVKKWD
jgi:3-hydroxyacyl-CoA dehydrogenase